MACTLSAKELGPPGGTGVARSSGRLLFALAIFLSAFLLFQVQLILGKYILPWFGGTPAVWTTCLLFFQLLLLGGYAYAHLLSRSLSSRVQARVHITLLAASVFLLVLTAFLWPSPITPGPSWKPEGPENPVGRITGLLLAGVGAPFLLLSTTGPLLQRWYAFSEASHTYRLYAVSNLGSLFGLLAYPFLFEPYLRLQTQARLWTAGYILFALGCAGCAVVASRTQPVATDSIRNASSEAPGAVRPFALWILLPGAASAMLLAATNWICQEVASVPFLWVLPLSLYLLTFVICFENERWNRRGVLHTLYFASAAWACAVFIRRGAFGSMVEIGSYLLVLFACCLVCHGELVRLKPPTQHLTAFYLSVATGGALGGILVVLVIPHVFSRYVEFQAGLGLCGLLLFLATRRDKQSWWHARPKARLVALVLLALAPLYILMMTQALQAWLRLTVAAFGLLCAALLVEYQLERRTRGRYVPWRWLPGAAITAVLLLGTTIGVYFWKTSRSVKARSRNFYGVLTVREDRDKQIYILMHGQTVHGFQYHDAVRRRQATTYYTLFTGMGLLMANHPARVGSAAERRPMRIGIVGLGIGTMACFGRPGDSFRFYEINPEVLNYARGQGGYFSYLQDSPAQIRSVLGDGRLSLEREAAQGELQKFDLLVLDAFNSAAVPVHLLTAEAFETYLKHLAGPESVIAVDVSNASLDFQPLLMGIAERFRMQLVLISGVYADWGLLARDPRYIFQKRLLDARQASPEGARPVLWTDDYSNLLRLLR
jgi:hypothetical protein